MSDIREVFESIYQAGFVDAASMEGVVTQDVDSPVVRVSMKNHIDRALGQSQQAKCEAVGYADESDDGGFIIEIYPGQTLRIGEPIYRHPPAPAAVPDEVLTKIASDLWSEGYSSESDFVQALADSFRNYAALSGEIPDAKGFSEQTDAWKRIVDTLNKVSPKWLDGDGKPVDLAIEAIRNLKNKSAKGRKL